MITPKTILSLFALVAFGGVVSLFAQITTTQPRDPQSPDIAFAAWSGR
jgi:HAMP domain-containing protein